jgi:ActR/RegA family two-component response regulator/predicted Ser/Thr protein kinase
MDRTPYAKKRVVLVIDSEAIRGARLKKTLNKYGYRVYTARDLKESRRTLAEKKIDVALLFLKQSDFSLEQFIKDLNLRKPMIVILESFSGELAVLALKAGAADFLACPIDSKELIKRIGVHARVESDVDYARLGIDICAPVEKGGYTGFWKKIFRSLYPRSTEKELIKQRYEKMERLGIGSFGEVWKVKDVTKDPPEIFVAKIPLDKKLNAKFEKEAWILKCLAGHKGVPKVFEMIEVRNKKALIQEFIVGKTLYEVIERDLEEKEVESVVIQLTDVVAHAHDLRVIHRDIKPENLMVRPDGTIKLLDFGAAKELKEKEMSATVTGSRPYMAPEQIMGKSQKRSDVWAIGVVMYVLYTGMYPFYHEVEKVLMDIILSTPPSPPSKFNEALDQEIERIIMKCLEKKPENRYPNAKALKEDLLASIPDYGKTILPLY